MKKILLTVVLGVAVGAVAQSTTPPAPGQSSTPPAQGQTVAPTPQAAAPAAQAAPVIKDPAEYNAYVAAYQQKDINARISGLEAFLAQYPNSVMKNQALEILMQAYQQANNVNKAMETATKLVAVDPCQVPAMTLLAYIDRQRAQSGDANGKQESADGGKYGQQGLDCLSKFAKPEGTSDADFQKMKDQMKANFIAAVGWAALQEKDYKKAAESFRAAVDSSPDSQKDLSLVYPLALSYLGQTPPDYQNGIWFAARAAAVAPAANAPGIEKYARSQYIKFHSADDGWADVLGAAKANAAQVPIKPAPTPAEQAHKMVLETPPDKMDFATWEFVFTNGAQEDQDVIWKVIKGKAIKMNGTIISTTPTEFSIAGSSDDIEAKKADISLKFEEKIPLRMIPKDGASFDFQGEPTSYTSNPFLMIMEKGVLILPKAAPKPPVHRKPAAAPAH
jgi:tetratricopeptide (TPR) repeat protein